MSGIQYRPDIDGLRAIAVLASVLQVELVAEGVETGAQHEMLTRLGCDEMQGYLLGRPMAATELEALLVRGRASAGASAGVGLSLGA